jgi:hypothetical protein
MVFLSWFRRCRLNAELFAPGTHKYAPGFAVGAWFIPVAMWWIPRRIALDIRWAGSPVGAAWLLKLNSWCRLRSGADGQAGLGEAAVDESGVVLDVA